MCDLHQHVVDDVGEVVGWVAVGFDEDEIVNDLWASGDITHHFVVIGVGFWVGFEAQWLCAVPRWWIFGAMVAVAKGAFFGLRLVAESLNFFAGIWVSVGAAGVDELLRPFFIDW